MTCSGCGRSLAPGERQYRWGVSDFVDAEAMKFWCPACWNTPKTVAFRCSVCDASWSFECGYGPERAIEATVCAGCLPVSCRSCGEKTPAREAFSRLEPKSGREKAWDHVHYCKDCWPQIVGLSPREDPMSEKRISYRCTGCGREHDFLDTYGRTDFVIECLCVHCQTGTADRVLTGSDLPALIQAVINTPYVKPLEPLDRILERHELSLQAVQEFRLDYEAEFGCCPVCGRFDGLSGASMPSDIVLQWSGRLDFETLPETEREMRDLIREKFGPLVDELLALWREKKGKQDG